MLCLLKHPSALRLHQHRNYAVGGFLCCKYVNLFVTQIRSNALCQAQHSDTTEERLLMAAASEDKQTSALG